ncbi:MAG TPA: RluA family pseudouridine synthase [Clostridiales bacterium]|nr:RluA family pseudouridine synthase [Clostridiales bacterium]
MDSMKYKEIKMVVDEKYNTFRVDKYIAEMNNTLSRSYIQKLILDKMVSNEDKTLKSNYRVKTGDVVIMLVPTLKEAQISPENILLDVLYEDKDIIIINKQKSMIVHPASGHFSSTLVNALLYHYPNELSDINGENRPGIVHRLDQDTTGAIIVCKNNFAHSHIAKQFKDGTVIRKYRAIVYNHFNEPGGQINSSIARHPKERVKMTINNENGRLAVTNYTVINNMKDNYSYIECSLKTGRTHQIRIHMASIAHPVLGDILYGPNKRSQFNLTGQTLHAYKLGIIHPTTNEYFEIKAPLPDYFKQLLNSLQD